MLGQYERYQGVQKPAVWVAVEGSELPRFIGDTTRGGEAQT